MKDTKKHLLYIWIVCFYARLTTIDDNNIVTIKNNNFGNNSESGDKTFNSVFIIHQLPDWHRFQVATHSSEYIWCVCVCVCVTGTGRDAKASVSGPNADEGSSSDCLPCQPGCSFCRDETPCVTRQDGALRWAVVSSQCLCMLIVFVGMVLVYHFRRNKVFIFYHLSLRYGSPDSIHKDVTQWCIKYPKVILE